MALRPDPFDWPLLLQQAPAPLRTPGGAVMHRRSCLWFWAWAAVGATGAIGLISFGPLAWAPAMGVGALLRRSQTGRRSAYGLLAGAGLLFLSVAYVQRDGPGTTCWHSATAGGCAQHLNPVPWLVLGLILLIAGLLAQVR